MRVAAGSVSLSSQRQITPLPKVRVPERTTAGRTSVFRAEGFKGAA